MSYNGMFQVGIHRRIRPVEQPKPFPVSLFSATLKCVHINQRIGGVGGVTVGKPSKIFFFVQATEAEDAAVFVLGQLAAAPLLRSCARCKRYCYATHSSHRQPNAARHSSVVEV